MTEHIEIRSTGEVLANRLPVGKINWDVPYAREYEGDWFISDPEEVAHDQIKELDGEIKYLEERVEDLEDDCKEEREAKEGAERSLSGLIDEVRAYLAGGADPEGLPRLKEALEGLE